MTYSPGEQMFNYRYYWKSEPSPQEIWDFMTNGILKRRVSVFNNHQNRVATIPIIRTDEEIKITGNLRV